MTLEECRKHLPDGWTELIQQDPILLDIFGEHEYDLENEAVPPFLIQDLRGGNVERLRPILALYGEPGLEMLRGLLEIDEAGKDTAEVRLPDGQTACAAYFFARFSGEYQQAAADAVKRYIAAIHQIYEEELCESAPIARDPKIAFLTGQEGRDFLEQMNRDMIQGKDYPDLYEDLGEWFEELEYRENCQELSDLLHESLYHISCDYQLSYYLQWPLLKPQEMENPFRPYFELWKMGLEVVFPEKDRVVLVG